MSEDLRVRGNPTPAELAAVLALLPGFARRVAPQRDRPEDSFERWRRARLAALRPAR
jgi:hypothetical protein